MKALRFEEKELWADAARAWRAALSELETMKGALVSAMHHEFRARAIGAQQRVDELMGAIQPLHKVEAAAEAEAKPAHERDPGAVTKLDAGETQGDTGAR
jgi:hypothetical protein